MAVSPQTKRRRFPIITFTVLTLSLLWPSDRRGQLPPKDQLQAADKSRRYLEVGGGNRELGWAVPPCHRVCMLWKKSGCKSSSHCVATKCSSKFSSSPRTMKGSHTNSKYAWQKLALPVPQSFHKSATKNKKRGKKMGKRWKNQGRAGDGEEGVLAKWKLQTN